MNLKPPQEVNVTIDTCALTSFVYAAGTGEECYEEANCRQSFDRMFVCT
jgi:hypothetical protein